jgi:hypothetical protein
MKRRNPQAGIAMRRMAYQARSGSDDLRFRCRLPEVLHSFSARLQNNRLFKLPTHFAR